MLHGQRIPVVVVAQFNLVDESAY